jgi:hypothetical protein
MHHTFYLPNLQRELVLKERNQLENLFLDRRIILKRVSKKQDDDDDLESIYMAHAVVNMAMNTQVP